MYQKPQRASIVHSKSNNETKTTLSEEFLQDVVGV